jgi:MFS family permease
MGIRQFGFDEAGTSNLVFAELVGVAAGGLLAGRLADGRRWYRVLTPSMLLLGLLMGAMPLCAAAPESIRFAGLAAMLGAIGVFGGLLLVPLESFIQVRPAAHEKGAVIAAANFAAFSGILLAGIVSVPLNRALTGTGGFAGMGAVVLAAAAVVRLAMLKGGWR